MSLTRNILILFYYYFPLIGIVEMQNIYCVNFNLLAIITISPWIIVVLTISSHSNLPAPVLTWGRCNIHRSPIMHWCNCIHVRRTQIEFGGISLQFCFISVSAITIKSNWKCVSLMFWPLIGRCCRKQSEWWLYWNCKTFWKWSEISWDPLRKQFKSARDSQYISQFSQVFHITTCVQLQLRWCRSCRSQASSDGCWSRQQ